MSNTGNKSPSANLLQEAEELLKKKPSKASLLLSDAETKELSHELEVHQIELQMQNHELQLAKEQAEIEAKKYTKLYDFAPSGYFTLSQDGEIMELNLCAAKMLNKERSDLINSRIGFFISNNTLPAFNQFLENVFTNQSQQTCEVVFTASNQPPRFFFLTGTTLTEEQCLVTSVDITECKLAETLLIKNTELTIAKEKAELSEQITKIFSLQLTLLKENAEKSELKYRSLIENSSDVVFCVDENGAYQFTNTVFASTFGKAPDYFIGKTFWDVYPKAEADFRQAVSKKAFETGETQSEEVTVPLPDKTLHFIAKVNPIKDTTGKVILSLTIATDITERKKIENALTISETRYRRLFETAKDGIIILDAETGMITDVNPYLIELLGYSQEQFIEKAIWEIGFFKDIVANQDKFAELQQMKYVRYEDLPLETADGRTINVEFVSNVYAVSNHKVIQCNIRNITDRKLVEDALNESESKYRHLYTSMNQGLALHEIVLNPEGKPIDYIFLDINDSYTRLLGVTREMAIGKRIKEVMPNVEQYWIDFFGKVALTGESNYYENYLETTGKYYSTYTYRPKENQFAVLVSDISERKLAEAEIQRINEQLILADADKDRFISILAHDLKSPFSALLGFAELLIENVRIYSVDEIEERVVIINKAAHNVYNLLEDILIWAQLQSGKLPFDPIKLNIATICSEVIEILSPNVESKNITISHSIPIETTVVADMNMTKTILRNLVSNAIKFTKRGGTIHISTQPFDDLKLKSNHFTDSQIETYSQFQIITVSDNGIGIPPEIVETLFSISQTHTTKGTANEIGTGLGLLLCKDFVVKHGGSIWVESEEGKGSQFNFTFPK